MWNIAKTKLNNYSKTKYSRVILVLNEVEFLLDSFASLRDSKFEWSPTPALKNQ